MKKLLPMVLGMVLLAGCAGNGAVTAPTETSAAVMEETTTTTTTMVTTPALPDYTEAPYEFAADFEPVVLLDVTEEFKDPRSEFSQKLGVKITLTGADESYLYVTVENLTGLSSRVEISNLEVNGMQVQQYNGFELKPNEVIEDKLRLSPYAIKWLGYDHVTEVILGDVYIFKASDTYGTDVQIHKTDITVKVSDAQVRSDAPKGYTLWEGDEGRMVLLGIDYDDNLYPRLMVRLENRQEEGAFSGLADSSAPSYLIGNLEVLEINGEAMNEGSTFKRTVESRELLVADYMLEPFMREGMEQYMPVGEVREMKLRFSMVMGEQELAGGELTLHPEEDGMALWGNPYEWMGYSAIEIPEDWEAYYEKLMQ